MACTKCNIQMIQKQQRPSISIAGVFRVVVFIFAIPIIFIAPPFGVAMLIFAIVFGIFGPPKYTVMVCPKCGAKSDPI